MARSSGRRPGDSGTREAIRAAAARQFAERGYDRTTLRSIAAEAEVDPALVAYFFGSKQKLFVEVVEPPFSPAEVVPRLFAGDRESLGERLAEFVLTVLENENARQRVIGLVRAAASEPEAARLVREMFGREMVTRVAEALDVEDGQLRANLVASQVVGLVMARYVIAMEPIAAAPPETLRRALAPNLQRYLTEPLAQTP